MARTIALLLFFLGCSSGGDGAGVRPRGPIADPQLAAAADCMALHVNVIGRFFEQVQALRDFVNGGAPPAITMESATSWRIELDLDLDGTTDVVAIVTDIGGNHDFSDGWEAGELLHATIAFSGAVDGSSTLAQFDVGSTFTTLDANYDLADASGCSLSTASIRLTFPTDMPGGDAFGGGDVAVTLGPDTLTARTTVLSDEDILEVGGQLNGVGVFFLIDLVGYFAFG